MPEALVESKITDKSSSLSDPRSVALCFIDYADIFFCFRGLYHIRPAMLRFFHLMCPFFIKSSKCDDFRDRPWFVDLATCPVKALEVYISRLKSNFQTIYHCTGPLLLFLQKKEYKAKRLAIQELENSSKTPLEILPDDSRISVSSLRAGGITSAANASVAGRFWLVDFWHGCWASENAKKDYVKDDFNYCVSVTKSLGF